MYLICFCPTICLLAFTVLRIILPHQIISCSVFHRNFRVEASQPSLIEWLQLSAIANHDKVTASHINPKTEPLNQDTYVKSSFKIFQTTASKELVSRNQTSFNQFHSLKGLPIYTRQLVQTRKSAIMLCVVPNMFM